VEVTVARHNMFLKLTGERTGVVRGESSEPDHETEVAVIDWGWGMTSPSAVGGGSPTGRIRYETLYVVKQADTASTALMSMMNTNELGAALLTVRKAGGGAIDYFTVKLEKARIVGFKIDSATSNEGTPCLTERLEFSFKSIEIEYRAQSDTGEAEGGSLFVGDAYPDQ
jgi:type VI secretion system secreted protein Hcp